MFCRSLGNKFKFNGEPHKSFIRLSCIIRTSNINIRSFHSSQPKFFRATLKFNEQEKSKQFFREPKKVVPREETPEEKEEREEKRVEKEIQDENAKKGLIQQFKKLPAKKKILLLYITIIPAMILLGIFIAVLMSENEEAEAFLKFMEQRGINDARDHFFKEHPEIQRPKNLKTVNN